MVKVIKAIKVMVEAIKVMVKARIKVKVNAIKAVVKVMKAMVKGCLLYTSPSPRDAHESRMPSSA